MYENSFALTKMIAAYRKPLLFTGRSTRTELLGYLIVSWLASTLITWFAIGIGIAASIDFGVTSFNIVNFILWLPLPALAVRRFHDQSRSGWWALPLLLPTIAAWIGGENAISQPLSTVMILFYAAALILLYWKPTDGENRYGPDPRLEPEPAAVGAEVL